MFRIALCLECPLHQHGGVEVLVCALIESLHESFELFLVSEDSWENLQIITHGPMIHGHFHWKPADKSSSQIELLIAWARENRINLLHFHMGGTFGWNACSWTQCAITQVAKAGFPCFSTNHQALWPFDGTRSTTPALRRIAAFAFKWPGKARQLSAVCKEVMVSDHDLAIQRRFFPFHRRKLIHIYHSRIKEMESVTHHNPESRIILSLATIAFRKGQHILVDAFALVAPDFPDWHLHLVGHEGERSCVEKVRHLAEAHGLTHRIHMPGSTEKPMTALSIASIYVQPSLLEGLGLSLQEAMFHGLPCIGSSVGGIPELITHESTGLLVPPGDTAALAAALRRLMTDDSLCKLLGKTARQHILDKGMTLEGMLERYLTLYKS